jgi:hypothetical protein
MIKNGARQDSSCFSNATSFNPFHNPTIKMGRGKTAAVFQTQLHLVPFTILNSFIACNDAARASFSILSQS